MVGVSWKLRILNMKLLTFLSFIYLFYEFFNDKYDVHEVEHLIFKFINSRINDQHLSLNLRDTNDAAIVLPTLRR